MMGWANLNEFPRIKIKGVKGVFVMFGTEEDAPITTQEDVDAFVPGFGHMYDGKISRFGTIICGREGWDYVVEASAKNKPRHRLSAHPTSEGSKSDK